MENRKASVADRARHCERRYPISVLVHRRCILIVKLEMGCTKVSWLTSDMRCIGQQASLHTDRNALVESRLSSENVRARTCSFFSLVGLRRRLGRTVLPFCSRARLALPVPGITGYVEDCMSCAWDVLLSTKLHYPFDALSMKTELQNSRLDRLHFHVRLPTSLHIHIKIVSLNCIPYNRDSLFVILYIAKHRVCASLFSFSSARPIVSR